jgi:hypothetical protein
MNEQIKFRIWDKEYNEYSEEPDYRILITKSGKIYNSEEDKYYEPNERYEIEHYIGVKDKDGNEVHKGDVVEIELTDQVYEDLGYSKASAIIRWDDNCACYYFDIITENSWCDDWEITDIYKFYIAGNIHENPELLKD